MVLGSRWLIKRCYVRTKMFWKVARGLLAKDLLVFIWLIVKQSLACSGVFYCVVRFLDLSGCTTLLCRYKDGLEGCQRVDSCFARVLLCRH